MFKFLSFFALALAVLACQPKAKPAAEEEPSVETAAFEGTNCYIFAEGKDTTFLTLTIQGTQVTGYFAWEPWEKDGARGDLSGTLEGNKIVADWDYVIEGSEQSEEKVFVLEEDMVGEMTGELTEGEAGQLVLKDPANAKVGNYLSRVECRNQ